MEEGGCFLWIFGIALFGAFLMLVYGVFIIVFRTAYGIDLPFAAH